MDAEEKDPQDHAQAFVPALVTNVTTNKLLCLPCKGIFSMRVCCMWRNWMTGLSERSLPMGRRHDDYNEAAMQSSVLLFRERSHQQLGYLAHQWPLFT